MAKISTASVRRRARPSSRAQRKIPVTEVIPGAEMVPNSTGGFAWQVDDWSQLDRFLMLGTEGGTFYIRENKLTAENAQAVQRCLAADGLRTVRRIVEVSSQGLAHRNDPAVFALAMATQHTDVAVKAAIREALPRVCRIGTHLLHFVSYANDLRGWGRSLRGTVAGWYLGKPPEALAYQAVKYQNRDGWSHRDVLRLVHPKAEDPAIEAVLRWINGGIEAVDGRTVTHGKGDTAQVKEYGSVREHLPALIDAVEQAKAAETVAQIVRLITKHNLPREAIPTRWLGEVPVWDALLQKMPMTAMIRNLGKMTSIGLLKPMASATRLVRERLGDAAYLRKSRIHPVSVLVAARTYGAGSGVKGALSWTPVPAIQSALDAAFYATYGNVVPIGKPLLVALDVSSSMGASAAGTVLRAAEVTAALSLIWLSTEPEVHVFGFAHTFRELGLRKGMTLDTACQRVISSNFGSTNIGAAVDYAAKNRIDVGGFVVMTDNEGNCGSRLATNLAEYRSQHVADARLVVLATAANQYSVCDPSDRLSLDIAGFDASVPNTVNNFIRGTGKGVDTDEASEDAS